ncbi:MAG: hypothetical protein RLZZ323_1328 [Bacteroidota bacterium]|jgi:hypothetical protein
MKNSKLKSFLKSAKINDNVNFEILNPSEEGELKGGLSCFSCGDFKCKGGFAPADDTLSAE